MVTKTLPKSPKRLHVIDVDKYINIVVDYVGIKTSVILFQQILVIMILYLIKNLLCLS